MTGSLHKDFKKLVVSWSQIKKRLSSGGWGPNVREHLAKCRSTALLGPGRFPQAVSHLGCWLELGGRGRHNDQAKNHGNAHQFLQIRRFVEFPARLFSNQEDDFPVGVNGNWSLKERVCSDELLREKLTFTLTI